MIQIDMQMPENCRMCPACSEYDICLIPVDGKGFGAQNVSEFTEDRPEWCPLKEQEAVEPRRDANCVRMFRCGACGEFVGFIDSDPGDPNEQDNYCPHCGRKVKWE